MDVSEDDAVRERPDQRHDFTRVDIQISIREGYHATVVLDNISGGKRLSHVLLLEVFANDFFIGENVIE